MDDGSEDRCTRAVEEPDGTTVRFSALSRWSSVQDREQVEGGLAHRADQILAERYTSLQWEELRIVLLRLVQPGEGVADTRRRQ